MMKKTMALMNSLTLITIFALFFGVGSTGYAACPDDLTAYWSMDETGSWDDPVGGNDAEVASGLNTPGITTGQVGGAQTFTDTGGLETGLDVSADRSFNFLDTDSFAVEFWFYKDSAPSQSQEIIVSHTEGNMLWWVGIETNDKIAFAMDDDVSGGTALTKIYSDNEITSETWYHVVAVRIGTTDTVDGTCKLYVNGTLQADTNQASYSAGFMATTPLTIGYHNSSSPASYFVGRLDELAIYGTDISDDVSAHYTSGTDICGGDDPTAVVYAPYPDDTVAFWDLDETAGATSWDDAVGDNDGEVASGLNAPSPESGKVDGAQGFTDTGGLETGIDVAADRSFNFLDTDSFSVEFWFYKSTAPSGAQEIMVSHTEGNMLWWVGIETNDKIAFAMDDDVISGTALTKIYSNDEITSGTWYHVVAVREGTTDTVDGTCKLYVNGTLQTDTNQASYPGGFGASTPLTIGYHNSSSPGSHFVGFMDEVAIYGANISDDVAIQYSTSNGGDSITTLRPAPTASVTTSTPTVTEGGSVTLDASGSSTYTGETIVSYEWTQTAGGTSVTPTVTAQPDVFEFTAPSVDPGGETYTFSLVVTASDGQSSTNDASVSVTIGDSSQPTANVSPTTTSVTEGDSVTLDGSGSNPVVSGATLSHAWTRTDTTGLTISDLSGETSDRLTFTAPQVDTTTTGSVLSFQLVVTENGIASDPATVSITVNDIAVSPDADAGPDQEVTEGATVTLDGSGSSAFVAGATLGYAWTQTDSTSLTVTLSDAAAVQPTFTAPSVDSAGATLTFRLTVTEDDDTPTGATNSDTVDIVVRDSSSSGGGGGGGGCFIDSMF